MSAKFTRSLAKSLRSEETAAAAQCTQTNYTHARNGALFGRGGGEWRLVRRSLAPMSADRWFVVCFGLGLC